MAPLGGNTGESKSVPELSVLGVWPRRRAESASLISAGCYWPARFDQRARAWVLWFSAPVPHRCVFACVTVLVRLAPMSGGAHWDT